MDRAAQSKPCADAGPFPRSPRPLRLLDLFSGIGGFSLGLERAGFQTVAFCEISPKCRHLLKNHWPDVPAYDDICTLTAERLAADGIAVDAICGGFPCQDISFAGAGAGIEGARSGLWREYARLIRELRPAVVVVENVAALTSRGLGVVLGDLALLGYDAEWDRIRAADVGAPHLRARLWIVAYARGQQHEGFGDAFRRALAAELPEAFHANTRLCSGHDPEADAQHSDPHGLGSHRAEVHELGGAELRHEQVGQPRSLGEHVADAPVLVGDDGAATQAREHQGERQRSAGGRDGAANVAHAGGIGCSPVVEPIGGGAPIERPATSPADAGLSGGWGWWGAEPDVGRVAHGVPAQLDGVHGYGSTEEHDQESGPQGDLGGDCLPGVRRGGAAGAPSSGLQQSGFGRGSVPALPCEGRPTGRNADGQGAEGLHDLRDSLHPDAQQEAHALQPRVSGGSRSAQCREALGWGQEPDVPRVAHGVPARVDRLHGLGNAVVPEIPYRLGRAILTAMAEHRAAA